MTNKNPLPPNIKRLEAGIFRTPLEKELFRLGKSSADLARAMGYDKNNKNLTGCVTRAVSGRRSPKTIELSNRFVAGVKKLGGGITEKQLQKKYPDREAYQ